MSKYNSSGHEPPALAGHSPATTPRDLGDQAVDPHVVFLDPPPPKKEAMVGIQNLLKCVA